MIRTSAPTGQLDTAATVGAYKNLARVERHFRNIKTDDLDLRPVHHYLSDEVRAHVLICMLAQYLTWHLRDTLAPPTYIDQHPAQRENPAQVARTPARSPTNSLVKTGVPRPRSRNSGLALGEHCRVLGQGDHGGVWAA